MSWRDEIRGQAQASSGYKKENTGKFAYTQTRNVQTPKARIPRNFESNPSNLERFTTFGGNVLKSGAGISKTVAGLGVDLAVDTFQGVVDFADPVSKVATGWYNQDQKAVESQTKFNNGLRDMALRDYKSGKITKDRYNTIMAEVSKNYKEINNQVEKNMSVIREDTDRVTSGAVDTAITILSMGSYAPLKAATSGSKYLVKGSTLGLNKFAGSIAKIEKTASKIPAVKALLARNGAKFTAANRGIINQSVRDAAVGIFLKQPFVYHATIDDAKDIYRDLNEGEIGKGTIGKIAFTVTLAFDGGIFGAATRGLKKFAKGAKLATLGRASYHDLRAMRFKGGNPRAWVEWMDAAKTPAERAKRIKYLKIDQEMNLNRWGTAEEAVEGYMYHISANESIDVSRITFAQHMDEQLEYLEDFEYINGVASRGEIINDLGEAVKPGDIALGSFTREAREQLGEKLSKLSFQEQMAYLEKQKTSGVLWAQNDITYNRVVKTVHGAATNGDDVVKAVRSIDTAKDLSRYLPKEAAERIAKRGRVLILPKRNLNKFIPVENTRDLITDQTANGVDTLRTVEAVPLLKGLNGALKKVGLSPEAANDVAYKHLKQSVTANLGELPISKTFMPSSLNSLDNTAAGKTILETLQDYATHKAPIAGIGKINAITDIRQLRIGEIQEALRVGKQDAKDIAKAIVDGYRQLPLELRGAGDRFVDNMFKYVPGYKYYNRAQSALRYTYNPFFRTQEVAETKILSKIDDGNLIWGVKRKELNAGADLLDQAQFFNTGFSGQGARDDVVLGRITANISKAQKRDLAGLGMKIAEKKGLGSGAMGLQKMIANHPDELEEALKVIVQYPSKGVLSSPLARTLNLAFFPMRYNLKVAGLTAKAIAKQPPIAQKAFLQSTLNFGNWLKSDEGLVWQSENSEALGVLKWITPYGSVESVVNLLNGRPDSISDVGLVGGLPAGFIFQLLDSNGVFANAPGPIKYQTPYVNPKTGEVYPEKIPESLKAKTAVALGDLINSTFTYPGRILGLPGKGAATRTAVGTVLQTDSNEYKYIDVEKDLTELQKKQSKLLKEKALDDMDHDELLEVFRTNGQWSIPNLSQLVAQPIAERPNHDKLNP